MQQYRVTFCDYETGKHIAADGPLRMDRKQILALMEDVMRSGGSFVSVMDEDGVMVQFVLDDDGSVMLDVPFPRKRGSYAKRTTLAHCVAVVEALGDKVSIEEIGGLTFERW